LLRSARRIWARRFQDCRLSTLEREVLGLEREEDVPGALIPALYFDFLRYRRAGPLARVFAHNRADVLSLAALLGWLTRAIQSEDALSPSDLAGLGQLCERVDVERSARYYRSALQAGLDGPQARRARLRLALWEKRCARWEAACALWRDAADAQGFDLRPWEELAKYHEHRSRDLPAAHAIVLEALALAATVASSGALAALLHRRARLERRLGLSPAAVEA